MFDQVVERYIQQGLAVVNDVSVALDVPAQESSRERAQIDERKVPEAVVRRQHRVEVRVLDLDPMATEENVVVLEVMTDRLQLAAEQLTKDVQDMLGRRAS